jgi:hypothetical protein
MLCKIVSGKINDHNIREDLTVYEWAITQDTFAAGIFIVRNRQLNINESYTIRNNKYSESTFN